MVEGQRGRVVGGQRGAWRSRGERGGERGSRGEERGRVEHHSRLTAGGRCTATCTATLLLSHYTQAIYHC